MDEVWIVELLVWGWSFVFESYSIAFAFAFLHWGYGVGYELDRTLYSTVERDEDLD